MLINSSLSCYSHAVALATRAFANALSCGKMKECASRVTAEVYDEHNEEEDNAEALFSALSKSVDSERGISAEEKVLAKLLVKVRAFISKVSSLTFSFSVFSFLLGCRMLR